jgi:hypothetical protein
MSIITPKPMSGFPELLPEQQIVFNRCIEIIRRNFELSGFAPIETPSVERVDVLTSKGGDEKEIYAIRRLFAADDDKSESEFALHFDLTVPLARYVAQHKDKLAFPFRRYQIQKVWRGERAQKGRYREFYQCDIDAIGRGSIGLLNDAEMPAVIYRVFTEMGIGAFVIRINNRKLLQGFYAFLGIDAARIGDALRIVDKLEKIGPDKVRAELVEKLGLDASVAEQILSFTTKSAPVDTLLAELRGLPMMADPLFARACRRTPAPARRRRVCDRSAHRARPRVLHRHDLRDAAALTPAAWQHLLGRPLRRPGQLFHQRQTARCRHLNRSEPADLRADRGRRSQDWRGHARARARHHNGPGAHGRLSLDRCHAAHSRYRDRGLC